MIGWQLLVTSLATGRATDRMRLWRAQKALGCATLRDGVYLLPAAASARGPLAELARQVEGAGGTAWVLDLPGDGGPQDRALQALFDREADYGRVVADATRLHEPIEGPDLPAAARAARALRRAFEAVAAVDFFPGPARERARAAVAEIERALARREAPDEPRSVQAQVPSLDRARYRGRRWATRRRMWVDRMASAWLIHRFVDPQAVFVWLDRPEDCPPDALGFDFDGAAFTHVGERVSFQVIAASFGLEADPGLARIGAIVHYLDVGGVPAPEAAGLETVLRGARRRAPDDEALLHAAGAVLDDLYAAFTQAEDET
jgi:hypothetical protein